GEAGAPSAECLLNPRRKREVCLQFGGIQVLPSQGEQSHRFVWRSDPAGAAVVGCSAVANAQMNDRGALPKRLGKDFYRDRLEVGVVTLVMSPGNEAGEVREPLCPAERLDMLVKDLIRGWCAGGLPDNLNFVWIFRRRSAILLRQT